MKGGAGKNIQLFVMVRGALKLALENFGVSVCCANPTLNTFYTINLRNCKITLEEETLGANTSIHFQLPHLYQLANMALLQIQTVNKKNMQVHSYKCNQHSRKFWKTQIVFVVKKSNCKRTDFSESNWRITDCWRGEGIKIDNDSVVEDINCRMLWWRNQNFIVTEGWWLLYFTLLVYLILSFMDSCLAPKDEQFILL